MNCTRLHPMFDAHIDGELDPATRSEIVAHLAGCPACTSLRDQRIALRQAVRTHAPYYHAPAALAPTLQRLLMHSAAAKKSALPGLSWLHAAAFASVTACAGLAGGYWLAQPQPDRLLGDPAVARHVVALTAKHHLIEVASADRHTVKPWFQGKLDFAPPVKDLKGDGFALLGARLDQVSDKAAAAVVYQIRNHVINLFVWRAPDLAADAIATSSVRGFSLVTWAESGLRFAAVSDVDARDLTRFAQLVSKP